MERSALLRMGHAGLAFCSVNRLPLVSIDNSSSSLPRLPSPTGSLLHHTARARQHPLRRGRFQLDAVPGTIPGIEPDLVEPEDYVGGPEFNMFAERADDEDYPYATDSHHSYHKGDDTMSFGDALSGMIKRAGGPNDHLGQAIISYLFLPVIFTGMAFDVQGEYLYLVGVLYIFAFIGIEMTKKNKPSNFEYNKNLPNTHFEP